MAQIIINIPDTQAPRLVAAVCNTFGYQATIPDPNNPGQTIANPQTQAQFAKQQVINYLMGVLSQYEVASAVTAARQNAASNVQTTVTLT